MFPSFLPAAVGQLTESESIALAQTIQTQAIATPLSNQPITTAYVHQGSPDEASFTVIDERYLSPTPPHPYTPTPLFQGSGGTPILLIHGFDSSVLEFRRLLPLLGKENETWAVDLLGFGFTDRLAGIQFSPVAIKTHLYYFWKTLINQPVILVGASMGGAAAIDFTLTYPEAVQKLVLIDSAGLRGGSPLSKFMFPPLDYMATQFLRSPKVRDRVSRVAYKNPSLVTVDALCCGALHLETPSWSEALIAFTKSGGYTAFRFKKLAEITPPTLILWGDSDKILGTEDGKRFKRAIPHSQLVWIEDCGHLPHLEQPTITAQHILNFCSYPKV